MIRISTILVAIVMLGMCTSSFGYFVVYNLSSTVKGADASSDSRVTIPIKGYLVLNISESNDSLMDANLILYGTDSNTTKKNKVYVQLDVHNTDGRRLDVNETSIDQLLFIDVFTGGHFLFEMLMDGKTTLKDIGRGANDKKLVATSLNGVNMVWGGCLLGPYGQEVKGTANASATIYYELTKVANEYALTQEQVVGGLTGQLSNKGYVEMVLP
jgi:hypothetical protein